MKHAHLTEEDIELMLLNEQRRHLEADMYAELQRCYRGGARRATRRHYTAAGVVLLCLLGLTTTAVAQRYPHQMNTNGHGSRTAAYALTDQIIANL